MKILRPPDLEPVVECPYLKGKSAQNEAFVAHELDEIELEDYLSKGWRKFGPYFFRPKCKGCQSCIPLRVEVEQFRPSKSQRRVLRKNQDVVTRLESLHYRREIYDLYVKHSQERFGQAISEEEFFYTHYIPSCPSFQLEFFLGTKLVALGFLDKTHLSLSSVYFIYDTDYYKRSLGNLGVLKEIECAQHWKLKYYYLGYFVPGNHFMEYKGQFRPHQLYDWNNDKWDKSSG